VQYGGEKELATLPHLTPGLARLAVVVWGVLYVYECVPVCAGVCGYAHLVPALYEDPTNIRADNWTYIHTYIHTYVIYIILRMRRSSSYTNIVMRIEG
jgi:hypothetical protein